MPRRWAAAWATWVAWACNAPSFPDGGSRPSAAVRFWIGPADLRVCRPVFHGAGGILQIRCGQQRLTGVEMPRFCTQCGTPNADAAKFCKACGEPISAPSPALKPAPEPDLPSTPPSVRSAASPGVAMPTSRTGRGVPVLAMAVLLLAIIGAAAWWLQQRQAPAVIAATGASAAAPASQPGLPKAASRAAVASAPGAAAQGMGHAASAPAAQALSAVPPARSGEAGHHEQGATTTKAQPQTFAPEPLRPASSKPSALRDAPSQRQQAAQPQTFPPSGAAQTPVPRPAAVPAPAPQPVGRVEALREGLAACQGKGNFFTQQLCIQETRWKYCGAPLAPNPLWGKIAECPNSAQQHNNSP